MILPRIVINYFSIFFRVTLDVLIYGLHLRKIHHSGDRAAEKGPRLPPSHTWRCSMSFPANPSDTMAFWSFWWGSPSHLWYRGLSRAMGSWPKGIYTTVARTKLLGVSLKLGRSALVLTKFMGIWWIDDDPQVNENSEPEYHHLQQAKHHVYHP